MSQPLLSIGMIVKNEERCLEKCLKALEPLRQAIPCELVIADTGSTDRTKEIASGYADVLFDFVWVKDFSKARNAVMDRCTGKWYLTLDADEYMVPDTDEIVAFLTSPKASTIKQATIVQRNFFNKNMDGTYADFNALRMCRMNTGARYIEPIHEHFDQILTYNEIYILSNTIFDHDGYAEVTPEHKAKKEQRNLELLRMQLEEEPDNLRTILQCMESATVNKKDRRYFTDYAIEKLKKATPADIYWDSVAPNLAKQVAIILDFDNDPYQEEWCEWTYKNFPNSYQTTIDLNFIRVKFLYRNKRYIEAIKVGKDYLRNLEKYNKKNNTATAENLTTTLLNAHEFNKNEVITLIANAMIEEGRTDEALKYLLETNLVKQSKIVMNNWFVALINIEKSDKVNTQISKHISATLKKYNNNEHWTYDYLIAKIKSLFQSDEEKDYYKLFENVPGTIGLSANIADSKTKEEAEKYLNQIENWDEFMPLALKHAILLNAELPKDFYTMDASQLASLNKNLTKATAEIINVLLKNFCNTEYCNNFTHTSFIFNLLLIILFYTFTKVESELKAPLINNFVFVANTYLSSCYNSELLENEKYITCISTPHLFAWYLVKANNLKETNSLEYVKTLRVLLNKIPESKQVVEFLIEEFQKEESNKKQEQIKNASPELIAMAEQLKTMLAALPENSPELLAIKQSPMYKQVAFLIED